MQAKCFWRRRFLRLSTHIGIAAILVMCPNIKLLFPYPLKAPYVILVQYAQWYLRRRLNCGDDGHRLIEAFYTNKKLA